MRKLAYEIKQRNEADYRFYRFEAEPALLNDLDHTLKITDGILRFRLFKVDPRAPLIEPPAVSQLGASRGGRRDERGRGRAGATSEDEAGRRALRGARGPGAPEAPARAGRGPRARRRGAPTRPERGAPEPDDSAAEPQASPSR